MDSGYKSQYNKGNSQNYGNKPSYQGQHQPVSNQATMQQPRINFGMITTYKVWVGMIPRDDQSTATYRVQVFEASV